MNRLLPLLVGCFLILSGLTESQAGNLALIEKRLQELERLNRQAVEQAGPVPKDGTVHLKAKVKPGTVAKPPAAVPPEEQFEFIEKTIVAIEEKRPYTIQISSSRSQAQCYRVAAMLRRAGYPAFTATIDLKDKGIWHRIFIGSFGDASQAQETLDNLTKDQIEEVFVRNMPYAIQVGKSGPMESLSGLRKQLFELELMPYSATAIDKSNDKPLSRLLVGAYRDKEDTAILLSELRKAGLEARVVSR